jgi:hypothetical protein
MSKEFKFNAAEVSLQAPVQVEGSEAKQFRVVEPRSDADRIAAARALGIQHSRASNANSEWGGFYSPAFFVDVKGFGSGWLACRILFLAQVLNVPAGLVGVGGKYLRDSSTFDPATGIFESATNPISLSELTGAYKLRIQELGISQVLLEEWASTLHTWQQDKEFYALPFADRMETFREKA